MHKGDPKSHATIYKMSFVALLLLLVVAPITFFTVDFLQISTVFRANYEIKFLSENDATIVIKGDDPRQYPECLGEALGELEKTYRVVSITREIHVGIRRLPNQKITTSNFSSKAP